MNLLLNFCYLVFNKFSSSPWGENIEPTPKIETGWANFDSSFGESIVANGDPLNNHEVFSDVIEFNAHDITPTIESFNSTLSPTVKSTRKNQL